MLVAIVLIFCVFFAPLWLILHYTCARRRGDGLTGEDEKILCDLSQIAKRMEGRVRTLETILDKQAPNWRDKG